MKKKLTIHRLGELGSVSLNPHWEELTPEELKEAYALAKAAFTADDLQKYTEVEVGVPLEDIIQELKNREKSGE